MTTGTRPSVPSVRILSGRRRALAKWLTVPVGLGVLVVAATVLWQAAPSPSSATDNKASGTVVLADDDSATAMFTAKALKPGSTASKCIVVTAAGTLAATVRLYGTGKTATHSLDSYLDLVVEQGTGGTFASCTGFVADAGAGNTYRGTLAAFATAYTTFGDGFGTFAPTGGGSQSKTYRITYTIDAATPHTAQGSTAAIGLTWESHKS